MRRMNDRQDATPPFEPELEPHDQAELEELLKRDVADNDEVPDTSEGVPQHHAPLEGSPA